MICLLNAIVIPNQQVNPSALDRLFLSGDGFFETMLFNANGFPLRHHHFERIKETCARLSEDIPDHLDALCKEVHNHWPVIKEGHVGRMRLRFFHSPGSGYFPDPNHAGFETMAMIDEVADKSFSGINEVATLTCDFHNHTYSGFKTGGSNLYTMAAKVCQQQGCEEAVLLNRNGWVAEGIHANIIGFKEGRAYTPRLETGCIHGVGLRFLKELFRKEGIACHDNFFGLDWLQQADEIWFSNALYPARPLLTWQGTGLQTNMLDHFKPLIRKITGP